MCQPTNFALETVSLCFTHCVSLLLVESSPIKARTQPCMQKMGVGHGWVLTSLSAWTRPTPTTTQWEAHPRWISKHVALANSKHHQQILAHLLLHGRPAADVCANLAHGVGCSLLDVLCSVRGGLHARLGYQLHACIPDRWETMCRCFPSMISSIWCSTKVQHKETGMYPPLPSQMALAPFSPFCAAVRSPPNKLMMAASSACCCAERLDASKLSMAGT